MEIKANNYYFKMFLIYLLSQPVIDIFTAYFILVLKLSITPGLILRNIGMLLFIVYILFKEKKHITYLFTLAVFYFIHFIVNYFTKDFFSYYHEISYFSKYIYFITVLIVATNLIQNINYNEIKVRIIRVLWIVSCIISICIIFAWFTNTGIQSYGSEKIGQIGWFFSGTKISAIMAILFPIALLYSIKKIDKSAINWIIIILNIIAMFITGTKTAYMGIILGLIGGIFICILRYFYHNEKSIKKIILILLVLTLGVILYTPCSPVYTNILIHQSWEDGQTPDLIFNGREIKVNSAQEDIINADILRKFLGVGFAGNYKDVFSIIAIERDFHEIFIYYGIVGFIIMLYYPSCFIYKILRYRIMNIKKLNIDNTMLLASLFSALGCSFIAGHVLFAPSVSIYLVCVMILLNKEMEEEI
ncbi:MAG: O-antigen ligase family protein [Eubacteriaceae bacterium]